MTLTIPSQSCQNFISLHGVTAVSPPVIVVAFANGTAFLTMSAISCKMLACMQVADVAVEAVVDPAASRKVVEIISDQTSPLRSLSSLFSSV